MRFIQTRDYDDAYDSYEVRAVAGGPVIAHILKQRPGNTWGVRFLNKASGSIIGGFESVASADKFAVEHYEHESPMAALMFGE